MRCEKKLALSIYMIFLFPQSFTKFLISSYPVQGPSKFVAATKLTFTEQGFEHIPIAGGIYKRCMKLTVTEKHEW